MNIALTRSLIAPLLNDSGSDLNFGDVVIVKPSTAKAFTTTTISGFVDGHIGVIVDPGGILDGSIGMIAFSGYVPRINLNTAAALNDYIKTHTVAGQGTPHATPAESGDFAIVLETGSTPAALLFGHMVSIDSSALHLSDLFPFDILDEIVSLDDTDKLLVQSDVGYGALKYIQASNLPAGGGGSILLDSTGTRVDIKNDNTEQTVYSFSVPGNTLGTKNALKLIIQARIIHSIVGTLTIRFKYGGTTMLTITVPEGAVTADKSSDIWFLLTATGATNTQRVSGRVDMQDANNAVRSRWGQEGTAAIDSTATQTLAITVQWDSASNSLEYDQSWVGLMILS